MKKTLLLIICIFTLLLAENEKSKNKSLSFGFRLGGGIGLSAPSYYYINAWLNDPYEIWYTHDTINWFKDTVYFNLKWKDFSGSFDFAAFVSLQLSNAFAIQTEMLFTRYGYISLENCFDYNIEIEKNVLEEERVRLRQTRPALIIPILAKLTFKPKNFSIQAFAGPHFTVNFGKFKQKIDNEVEKFANAEEFYNTKLYYPPAGLTGGGNFGIKTEKGIIFFDTRYFTDLGVVGHKDNRFNFVRRARLSLTVGYEFASIPLGRNKKTDGNFFPPAP